MNIFKRFKMYCWINYLRDRAFLCVALRFLEGDWCCAFYQQLHTVIENSLQSIFLPPSLSCRHANTLFSFLFSFLLFVIYISILNIQQYCSSSGTSNFVCKFTMKLIRHHNIVQTALLPHQLETEGLVQERLCALNWILVFLRGLFLHDDECHPTTQITFLHTRGTMQRAIHCYWNSSNVYKLLFNILQVVFYGFLARLCE